MPNSFTRKWISQHRAIDYKLSLNLDELEAAIKIQQSKRFFILFTYAKIYKIDSLRWINSIDTYRLFF